MLTDVVPIHLRVLPRDIALIKFVIESYEGVGVVRTVNRREAVIVILAAPDCVETVRGILDSLRTLVAWEPVSPPSNGEDWLLGQESDESV